LFYILKKNYLSTVTHFFKIYYQTSFQDPTLSGATITSKYIQNFVRKPEGKRSLRRPRHKWEDNTRMDQRLWAGFIWLRI